MQALPIVPLNVHSAYSLSEGAIRMPALISYCTQHQIPALALTDTHNLFGAMEFALACLKEGIQPIIGVKARVKPPSASEKNEPDPKKHGPLFSMLTLLVQSQQGYQNLIRMISQSYIRQQGGVLPHLEWKDLEEGHEGLIALCGAGDPYLELLFQSSQTAAVNDYFTELHRLFGDRLYVNIARFHQPIEEVSEPFLLKLAVTQNIPIVATNEAYFKDPSMFEAHNALLCIADGTYLHQDNRRQLTPHHYLKSPSEMAQLFADLPEALANTALIAKRCHFLLEPSKPMLPSFPSPLGEDEELKVQAEEGLRQRLSRQVLPQLADPSKAQDVTQLYESRLAYEITVINKMGYAGYYLIVADFIKWAKAQNIPVGPGRGSGAGSLVAWALTITDVDPIQLNLLFERFLNPERVSMPDFDIDFCQDRRDEVIQYVCTKYGQDHVAQIITFGKLQARAALRDVGRVLGMPYNKVDGICKLIPNNPANPVSLHDALQQEPELRTQIQQDQTVERLFDMAQKLEGLYRHASTHAAGVVIGKEPLDHMVPLYYDGESPLPATQFSMKYVELAGLVKFDFLGLRTLTVMQKAVDILKTQGIVIELHEIPLDDQKTFEMLQRMETLGVFQIESAGMRDVLRKLQPSRFEEIVALVALYRPGPMDDIPRYLACKHGEEAITYLHPMLEPILSETFGVMVYQEQVMQIAQKLGGYSLGQADLLRRAMGKKIKAEMDAQREFFIQGCEKHSNISGKIAHQIFDQMAKFASYGFNKCHSAPYGLISYQTAYLKANYPVAFLAALLTYDMHNTDKLNLIREEMNRLEIPLLPPDINKSEADFCVEILENGQQAVRYAMCAIKNVGLNTIRAFVSERETHGAFTSIENFFQRVDAKSLNKRQLEFMIAAGCFDTLEPNRHRLMNALDAMTHYAAALYQQKQSAQINLFGGPTESSVCALQTFDLPQVPYWSRAHQIQQEFDAIGFYLREHPLDTYRPYLETLNIHFASAIPSLAEKQDGGMILLAGVLIGKKERLSKNGQKYAFAQFSDPTGAYEGVLFSDTFAATRSYLEPGHVLLIKALIKKDETSYRLTLTDISPLEEYVGRHLPYLEITIHNQEALGSLMEKLKTTTPGLTQILLKLAAQDHRYLIRLPGKFKLGPDFVDDLKSFPCVRNATFDAIPHKS